MLHVICTQLHLGYLSIGVGDSSQHSEEIVKSLELRFSMGLLLLLLLSGQVLTLFTLSVAYAVTNRPATAFVKFVGLG